ncbi:MAG: GGDEF domain-containing protein [Fibrobacter sp.]|nr:GGDEF domain-containing protein [Fibrobacter sp.]
MESPVDIRMALGTDIIGMTLVVVMIIGNVWRLRLKNKESLLLIAMLGTCFSCCLSDLLAFAADGSKHEYARQFVYFTNTWLYASNYLCAYSWLLFLREHFKIEMSPTQKWSLRVMKVVLILMLGLNLFVPFIFSVNEYNIYNREFGYWIYVAFNYGIVVNSITLYYKNYRRDGSIRFFPIWLYIVPIVIATVIQSLWYGVSLMAPCFAVAIAGAFNSLQNERVFRDNLTGLFNRSFLDYVLFLYSQQGRKASGIMVSLCGFEKINEDFGHGVGDKALCQTAEILRESVGSWGSILRYSGDEFIIMVDSQQDNNISNCIEKLKMNFDRFNREETGGYKLIPAIGVKKHSGEKENANQFLNGLKASVKTDKQRISP